jgi:hypothetical protein
MPPRYYVDLAANDPDGFFSGLIGWVVYDTHGLGTATRPWAVTYSPTRESAEAVGAILNAILEEKTL